MASPYRFDAEPQTETEMGRSRTGLSAVTAGATSGGDGYRRSALLPGSRGFAAANFGAAPRTDYVAPVAPVAETPAATQTATPTVQAAPAVTQDNSWEAGRGGAGIEGGGPGANGMEPAGEPGDLSDLASGVGGLIGDISPGRGALAGAGIGASLAGPAGAVIGGLLGYGAASAFGGGSGNTGAGQLGNDPKGDMETNAMGGGTSGPEVAGPDPNANAGKEGLATGGRVGPQHLRKGMPMHGQKGGLGAVTAGKKPFMGGYAEGGKVGVSGNDVNNALWKRAKRQAAPTPEMIQAQRETNAPIEMRRGGMRFAENNAQADAAQNAPYSGNPQHVPEVHYLGDPKYIQGAWDNSDDPLHWYYADQARRDGIRSTPHMVEGAPIGENHRFYRPRTQPTFPGYQEGGPVDALAGPDPAGPDDGFAALDQGEFVVKQDQAQRPDYGPILEQMNAGTYAPESASAPGMEGGDDLDLDMGAQGNYPPSGAESATPDDMMQRLAMMPPEQSQALSQAAADPMLMGALFALLGPAFMGVISAIQSQGQQAPGMGGGGMQPPGMLGISPDRAGMRPPGGGLGSISA